MKEIKGWLVDWFTKNGTVTKDVLLENMSKNYFNEGFLDSFTFISLIADIEEQYDIEFDNDQFLDREFATLDGLAEIIAGLVR